jgi:hypothetical protein
MDRVQLFFNREPSTVSAKVNGWIARNKENIQYIESIQMATQANTGGADQIVIMVHYFPAEGKEVVD